MSTDFMFDFLPSFYRDFMVDSNGVNVLTPLFEQYTNYMSDALFQTQQLSWVPYLEKCPIVIKEYYKTIDIRESNKYDMNAYIIENDIIGFDTICFDGSLQIPITFTFTTNYDAVTKTRYIEFSDSFDPRVNTLYVKLCYRNKNILENTFGRLLNYIPEFLYTEYSEDYVQERETYRDQLIALLYCSVNGQSFSTIEKSLSIFLGLQYAPFDAIVRDNTGDTITLEDIKTGNLQTIYGNINYLLSIGTSLNKYDILENSIFYLYDMYSDPARFTQYLVAEYSENLLTLLNIDTENNEQYAHLNYDSLVVFDGNNIYWDMGNNTGIDINRSQDWYVNYPYYGVQNSTGDFLDTRFDNQKVYEMFRNVFIIEFLDHQYNNNLTKINYFLTRFKPIYSKYLIYNPSSQEG